MKQSSIASSPPPLPLPSSTPVLNPIDKSSHRKPIDEREKLFLLYESQGQLSEYVTDPSQLQSPRLSTTDPNAIDHHGFIHDQPVKGFSLFEKKQMQQEIKRSERWNKMLKKSSLSRDNEKLRRRMYKGLPSTLRGAFWSRLFDLDEQLRINKGHYEILKKKARLTSTFLSQIDLDVNRTYRNHQMFCNRYCLRQKHLFSILAAYSVYNTEVGYTQGMNQIVAFLLFYLPEEEAFWAFCQLMTGTRWMMHGFFSPGFPKLFRFQAQFDKIIRKMLPKVHKHFANNQVQTDLYTIRWFMLCYLDCLPFPLTLRLWDIYILEGEQVLLTTAYCILRVHRKKLLNLKSFDSINTFLKTDLCKNFANTTMTWDEIIEEYIVCYEKLKQNNLLSLPMPLDNELPTKPFNISMGDITKLTQTDEKKVAKSVSSKSDTSSHVITNPVSITTTTTTPAIPAVETFLVTSSAPLATADEESPSIINFRDISIENQYLEIKRITKPFVIDDQPFLTEYDSCTVLSSADPSLSGYRRKIKLNPNDDDDDDETLSSKSDLHNDLNDEHIQISQLITTSFLHDDQTENLKRSPSFYDNVDQTDSNYYSSTPYTFDTDIR